MKADDEWEVVSGQGTERFEYETTGVSFEVRAVVFNDAHSAYAQSKPVEVVIDDHEDEDPHIWLDPVLAKEQVNNIRDALIEADPEGQDIYEKNAKALMKSFRHYMKNMKQHSKVQRIVSLLYNTKRLDTLLIVIIWSRLQSVACLQK